MSKEIDYEFFKKNLPEYLKEHKGQFALIKNMKVHGFYSTLEDALKNGYTELQDDFIIQEVINEKPVNYINSIFLGS